MYPFRSAEKATLQEIIDRTPLYLEVAVTENWIAYHEGIRGALTGLGFYGFSDVAIDGDGLTNRLRRKSMKTEKGKRAWNMGSQNLSQGRKPNMNI